MEHMISVEPNVEAAEPTSIQELNDLELSAIAGGCGEFTPY